MARLGCGNGAFTEMLVERCAGVSAHGKDPEGAARFSSHRICFACSAISLGQCNGTAFPPTTLSM
jgi:hypothetical protein